MIPILQEALPSFLSAVTYPSHKKGVTDGENEFPLLPWRTQELSYSQMRGTTQGPGTLACLFWEWNPSLWAAITLTLTCIHCLSRQLSCLHRALFPMIWSLPFSPRRGVRNPAWGTSQAPCVGAAHLFGWMWWGWITCGKYPLVHLERIIESSKEARLSILPHLFIAEKEQCNESTKSFWCD